MFCSAALVVHTQSSTECLCVCVCVLVCSMVLTPLMKNVLTGCKSCSYCCKDTKNCYASVFQCFNCLTKCLGYFVTTLVLRLFLVFMFTVSKEIYFISSQP